MDERERTAWLTTELASARPLVASDASYSDETTETLNVFRVARRALEEIADTEAGAIYVFNPASDEFQLRATYGMDEALTAAIRERHIRIGDAGIGQAAARRK